MSLSSGFKLLVPCALALYFASACLPDMSLLSADYVASAGASGSGNGSGGTNSNGGGASQSACENGERDENESDVDCGGPSDCDRCAPKARCTSNRDCQTDFCKNLHCAAPTCTDLAQNGDETGSDCGGSCPPCDVGNSCDENSDCEGEYCADGVCGDHCTSGAREADETDKDCGGSCVASKCGDGKHCLAATDCESAVCSNQVCIKATCSDNVQNQDESDKDCGGICADTKPCTAGQRCISPADCDSWICSAAGKCVADIAVLPNDILDDFEDGNNILPQDPALGGRVGNWYPFSDGSGTSSYGAVSIDRGASKKGFEATGKNYTGWGSGVGVDMAVAKAPYDASKYDRLTFWARATTAMTVTVVFPDIDTAPEGNLCTTCDHHYLYAQAIGPTWQRYTISFSALNLESGTVPPPKAFKPEALISVQFRVAQGVTYDMFLDDIAFLPKATP